jgi:hypothetical protein
MGAKEAVDFLIKDHGDVGKGFREVFAQDKPYKSILQRNKKTLDEVLKLFDWKDDCDKWVQEYNKSKKQDMEKLIRYRRMVSFCIGGWREFNEDFGRGDVSCLIDIRTPLVTSRSPLKAAKDEFDE